jgi:CxxC motif-containing protein (DUF1111 family)
VLFLSTSHLPGDLLLAEDLSQSAGALTSDLPLNVVIELPPPQLQDSSLFDQHLQGHSLFHSSFQGVRRNGLAILGPHFVNDSCGSCHIRAGRGSLIIGQQGSLSSMVVKVGLRRGTAGRAVPGVGEQLQEHSAVGPRRYKITLSWKHFEGMYPDGTPYTLRRPKLSFSIPKYRPSSIVSSLRMTPPLVGMGLLEAIPVERLEELSDPNDENRDGISGRIHYLKSSQGGLPVPGRFGFRASNPSLREQTGAALLFDLGITSNELTRQYRRPELSNLEVDRLVTYQQLSGVPKVSRASEPRFLRGAEIFTQLGCGVCHVPTHTTSASASPPIVASQVIHPYTDLLLHDMGRGLADSKRERSVGRSEWRTAPLWVLGLAEVTAVPPFGYLHDGRARTVEEAILWHGGEASTSRALFTRAPLENRQSLLYFLGSL